MNPTGTKTFSRLPTVGHYFLRLALVYYLPIQLCTYIRSKWIRFHLDGNENVTKILYAYMLSKDCTEHINGGKYDSNIHFRSHITAKCATIRKPQLRRKCSPIQKDKLYLAGQPPFISIFFYCTMLATRWIYFQCCMRPITMIAHAH